MTLKEYFIQFMQYIMATIEPGMWLQQDCINSWGIRFEHDGIVVDVGESGIAVMHFAWSKDDSLPVIRKTKLQEFMAMGKNTKIVTSESAFHPDIVVSRAYSQQGRADYHLLGRNCQHFGSWCYRGSEFSRSVFNMSAVGAGLGVAISVVCIAGMVVTWRA
jgi:hypothetical protein